MTLVCRFLVNVDEWLQSASAENGEEDNNNEQGAFEYFQLLCF